MTRTDVAACVHARQRDRARVVAHVGTYGSATVAMALGMVVGHHGAGFWSAALAGVVAGGVASYACHQRDQAARRERAALVECIVDSFWAERWGELTGRVEAQLRDAPLEHWS